MSVLKKLLATTMVMIFTNGYGFEIKYKDEIYKGKVKSVKYSYFQAKGKLGGSLEKTIDEERPVFKLFFNKKGKISERWLYVAGNILAGKEIYQYDKNNYLIGMLSFGGTGELDGEEKYKYNSQNKLIEKNKYGNGELSNKSKYEYDNNGNQIKEHAYFYLAKKENKFDTGKTEYKYKNKKIQSELSFSKDNVLQAKFEYNGKGNKVKSFVYDKDGLLELTCSYFYNKANQLVKEETIYARNRAHTVWLYKYDENDNIVETSVFRPENTLFAKDIFVYQYDEAGNWISKTSYSDGDASYITEREIKYHK